ncbi:MAG TPA: cytochrome c class I, partial [Candidatus Tectomicrobia bacterium]|nr:cytochrome c class I [Candidatus Tectomicrobia bacterium]
MRARASLVAIAVSLWAALPALLATPAPAQPDAGSAARGAVVFRQCAACHSAEPGVHLSGPSLARVWGRRAGTVEGFTRYSEPLARSGVVWDVPTLDRWLQSPQAVVPGNLMTYRGLDD